MLVSLVATSGGVILVFISCTFRSVLNQYFMKATKNVSNLLFSFQKKFQLLSVVSIVFVLLNDGNVKAQSPTDGYVITTGVSNGNVNGFVHVDLPDTVTVASLEVKLGSTEGGAEILQHVFMYDVSQGLPSGFA
jgi:hypothetical protein